MQVNSLFLKKLELQNFNVVIAFSGWSDANQAATYSVKYLKDNLKMKKIGEINLEGFYNFSLNRPIVTIEGGLIKDFKLPKNELYALNDKYNDLLVLIGDEPHLNWFNYVNLILQLFSKANLICLIGSLIDKVPHTIEPIVSCVATRMDLIKKMKENDVEPVNYIGPSSIHSLILNECIKKDISALSIWGHTQDYITGVDYRAAHKLLRIINAILNLNVNLTKVKAEENNLQKILNDLMSKNQSFAKFINQLELEYKLSKKEPDYIV
ncbi:PAC2 family protein [Candidatus Bathyarchaeota archaeon]|nr:PAC2 family protein [Candidatus Bathyarchaeota archaeon]